MALTGPSAASAVSPRGWTAVVTRGRCFSAAGAADDRAKEVSRVSRIRTAFMAASQAAVAAVLVEGGTRRARRSENLIGRASKPKTPIRDA
jgi:hypothetical protein